MEIFTRDFTYDLPEDRIALFPTEQRDQSKLLVYRKGSIDHSTFQHISEFLPAGSHLVFNNSKVIPARLKFRKPGGAVIEIFLLNPADRSQPAHKQVNSQSPVRWVCTIGNKKRWSNGQSLSQSKDGVTLVAQLVDEKESVVEFTWRGTRTWSETLFLFGETPLPPYIKRDAEEEDVRRYQTVYSAIPGAVAAPTAGLHFTPNVFQSIDSKGFSVDYLTLHVGAGTFLPIKSDKATDHHMHEETIVFTLKNIENLLNHIDTTVAVGTTSCRSLESLYWFGVKLIDNQQRPTDFKIGQFFPVQRHSALISRSEALKAILEYMSRYQIEELIGSTSIFIYPGYRFRMTDGLITNFHQPNSTLLLLIAAFVGDDWKRIYSEALKSDYRFLSYGDSSLLLP
jgi:S-adenosylmethionine:tRNA ribosyltransferase-isomerase